MSQNGKGPRDRRQGQDFKKWDESKLWKKLEKNQVEPDPEAQKVLENNLWDLMGPDENGERG